MSREMGTGSGGLYVVEVPRPRDTRKRKRDLPTVWNGRTLEPHEQQAIADGYARDLGDGDEIVKGRTA